ncbi:MAG: asparagine synthase-related protein, partial [Thermoleophilaceae bacterium]
AYAKLFERARELGIVVLLDGQGMDEQWAGYDYYLTAAAGGRAGLVQGTLSATDRVDCLTDDFRELAEPLVAPQPFPDPLRNTQYRDACLTKIPRAVRFNDRISMRSSTELRSPFLDHRLFELAFRQREDLKLRGETRKWLPRRLAAVLAPGGVVEAPKRPLQTPQREWLRGPLSGWAGGCIEAGLDAYGGSWLRSDAVREAWRRYRDGEGDNSYFVWQWVSVGLMVSGADRRPQPTAR